LYKEGGGDTWLRTVTLSKIVMKYHSCQPQTSSTAEEKKNLTTLRSSQSTAIAVPNSVDVGMASSNLLSKIKLS
jgi:hypothetical protein